MNFSMNERQKSIQYVKEHTVDLLVIGGGITGAGVALQAAASGLDVALVEMQDFAEGTSSRSTKLVHGGLRYLKTFDVEVVSDTVKERAIVQQVAPHIPRPEPMLLPIYDEGNTTFNLFSLKVAMDLYDDLAKVKGTSYENQLLTKEEVLARAPQLKQEGLLGGGVYLDFKNNDARLVIENIKQAQADGGHMLNRTKVIGLCFDDEGKVVGGTVEDQFTGETYDIKARVVINTTGPWSDTIRQLSEKDQHTPQMRPTKGVHLVVDKSRLSVEQPVYFDTGKQDGRMVFVIPREEKTYFGTTDTDYLGDFKHPTVTQEDVDYLLSVVNHRFPDVALTLSDIESSWAGLRPLIMSHGSSDYNGGNNGTLSDDSFEELIDTVKGYLSKQSDRLEVESVIKNLKSQVIEENPSAVSRGSHLETDVHGLVTLSGGKITDYRLMAEGALDVIKKRLATEHQVVAKDIDSTTYQVSGGHFDPSRVNEMLQEYVEEGISQGLSRTEAEYLANLYGSNMPQVLTYSKEVVEGLTSAQSMSLLYALNHELVLTPVDYFLRRTNYLLFMSDKLVGIKAAVVRFMASYFGWDREVTERMSQELDNSMAESSLIQLKGEK